MNTENDMVPRVRLAQLDSVTEAEAAATVLRGSGIRAFIEGDAVGHMMQSIVPTAVSLWVEQDEQDAAKRVLDDAERRRAGATGGSHLRDDKRLRLARRPIFFFLYLFGALMGVALSSFVIVAVADAVHATPHGHAIKLWTPSGRISLIPVFGYLMPLLAVFFAMSERIRRGATLWAAGVLLLVLVGSVYPREHPLFATLKK